MIGLPAALLLAATYVVEGLVLGVNVAERTVTVSHKEIAGAMPAMAMPLRVGNAKELAGLKPGVRIRFELTLDGGRGQARKIKLLAADNSIEEGGRRIALEAPKEQVAVGDRVPDFSLVTQEGKAWSLNEARGKVVAIQFLYTRCPMPEVCPRLAATFAALQRRFAGRGDLMLLSVTLDPVYDTPAVLSRYATLWRSSASRWLFGTGSTEQIRMAAARFGIVYWPEEGVITHTSNIAVIGRTGRLEARVEGLSFTARQLGDLVEHTLDRGSEQ
ncbi:MAG: SCO family protein [Bryobacterales bacterium]|nr:SCO family protein [Bryobacterales bacterium]